MTPKEKLDQLTKSHALLMKYKRDKDIPEKNALDFDQRWEFYQLVKRKKKSNYEKEAN